MSSNGHFIRLTSARWQLTPEQRKLFAAMLIYMRNEWRVASTAVSYEIAGEQPKQTELTSQHFKDMVTAIDRILSRINNGWDAWKLAHAMSMAEQMMQIAPSGQVSKDITRYLENRNGVMAIDSCWRREYGQGDGILAGETGPEPVSQIDSGGSDRESNQPDEHNRPGGHNPNPADCR